MAAKSCSRCGAAAAGRPVTEYTATVPAESVNNTLALVQFRFSVNIEIDGQLVNFYSAQIAKVGYSTIAVLLTAFPKCLYFPKETDRIKFYATYPELR